MSSRLPLCAVFLVLAGCGESGQKAVKAASKAASEAGQQLAEQAAELARTTPEQAKEKLQEFVDAAAGELKAARDSETAHQVASELQGALEELSELRQTLGAKINLTAIQQALQELIEKFENDPRVVSVLKSLQEKLQSFSR